MVDPTYTASARAVRADCARHLIRICWVYLTAARDLQALPAQRWAHLERAAERWEEARAMRRSPLPPTRSERGACRLCGRAVWLRVQSAAPSVGGRPERTRTGLRDANGTPEGQAHDCPEAPRGPRCQVCQVVGGHSRGCSEMPQRAAGGGR